ncbi:unnamed protein product [Phytophthora lilii]|uniref:Unnamed protein product n=1 Tax=Phytophthora lilii TaxID=2077276 RepID=A0A9W6X3U4_9STRA|nr:unnamed protein product [Phytophthora lilii]
MTEIFRYLPSHGLPNLESGVAEEMRQNSFGNDIFEIKSLMITLLRRSSTEAIKHLENEALTDFTIEPDCFLRLLHVLQTHYFSIVYRVASQQYRKDPIKDISQQIMDSLLEYVDALMAEALAVLKRLHNASRQHEEIITWRLNGSFFQTVLPNAIECISVILLPATYKETIAKNNTPRTGNFQLVERVLPNLHVMLKMLDEVSWKMHSAGDGNNQTHNDVFPSSSGASSVEHNWFVYLSEACAVLCGKLSCELFYPSTVIDELPNADGETYSSLILSEGRLFVKEHDALSVAYAKRSSSVCTILEWERLGVFEVEDELVVSEEEPCTSGSTRPLAVDVHANQRYLLQLCETDFKGKPLSFWSWVASNLSETLEFSTESQRLLTVVVSVLSWHLGLGNELQHAYELYEVAPTDLILTVSCATFPTGKIWGLLRALIDNGKSWSYRSIDANCVANSIKLGHLLLNLQPNPAFVPPVLRNTCSTIDTSKQFVWVDDSLTPLFDFLTKAVDINVMHNILCMKEENGALARTGICIIHDLLRKLTTSSAKSGLLDELVYATCATNRTSLTRIPLPQQITLKGNNNQQVSKAIENLFIQLARIVSSDDASLELKRKALLAWTVPFSTKESDSSVVALIAKAGIVSSLIELLLEEANVLDTHSDINAFMQTITIGSNAAVTLAEGSSPSQNESSPTTKVAPTDATFFDQTPAQGISMLAWDAFCVISLQLGHSDYFAQHRAVLLLRSSGSSIHDKEPLTPRSTSLSPRRRLTLPKKMIISTVDEIIEEMIDGLFLLLKGVKYRLEALDCLSKQCDTSKVDKSSELVLHISKISSKPISEETIARIHQNGIVLFQLKQYHIASSYCVKILRLLSQLIDGRKQSSDEAVRGPMSDRWIVLLHSMLVTTCRDQDLAQVYLCYLLQDVLSRAPPLPAFDTHSLIKSLFSSHTELTKMQVLLNEFSNLSNENSTTSPMKQQQNDALHALMAQHGMLYGRYRYGTSASAISSKTILSLRFAAGVHLFQGLSRTLGWKEQLSQFIVSSISTLLSVRDINDFIQAVESSKLNVVATLGNVVAGYSEESLNGHRALGRDSALFPAGIRTCNAPFESVARFDENNADQTSTLHALIAALLKEEVRQKLGFPARKDIVVKCQNDIIAVNAVDERIRTVLHLRACAFRVLVASLLREQCEKTSRIWHRFLLENTEACDDLLQTASLYTREHVMTGLGYDAKAAMKLRRVRIFMKEILRGRKHRRGVLSTTSLAELENLQWQLWEEMAARHPAAELIPWWQQNSEVNGKVALEIVGGDVELCDLKVTALEHFPTVGLAQTNICANSGMWFYEVVVLTDGLMQVGYVDGDFIADPMQGQGVGDHTNSWAFDGFRCKKWNVNSYDYGEQWKAGDVVGVLLDTDRMEISYLLNGKFLGVAFSGLPVTASSRLCPAASLNVHQSAEFNFGTSSALSPSDGAIQSSNIGGFKHLPIQDSQDQARLRPVIMALAGRCAPNEDNGLNLDCQNAETKLNEASEDLLSSSSSDSDTDDAAIAFEGTTSLPGFSTAVDSSSLEGHDTRVTDQSDEEHIQRRRDLVEGLTGLGFPIDWATRYATETRLPMDETGAVAWILGQMEKVGLDGVSSLPSTLDDDSTLGQTSARVQLPNLVVSHSADYLDTESSAVAASETTKHLKRTDDNEIARAADIYNSRDSAASVFRPQDCGVLERQNVSSTATNSFLDSDKSDKQIDDALWEPFQSSPYCQRENDNNATFLLLDATNTSAFGDSNRGVDDLPPLSASVDIALFVGYTRQAFTSLLLLALDKDEREAIYKMVQRIAVNDTSCSRFYQFLRLAIGLDAMDFSFEIGYMSDGICPERSLQLQKALAALLRYEVELISPEHSTSENPPETSPLLKSLCKEMQRQCDRGLAFARLKQTNKNGSELSVMQTSAAWFAWVSGLVLRLVEAEISPKLFKPHFRFAVPAFQNTAFVENLVALASSSSSIFIAWKYVAIRLISRILAAMKANDDAKSNDISCVQSSGNPCASLPAFYATAQLANLAEFFTLRRRREMHSRAFFSDITCTLFPLLVHSCAPFDHISNLIELRLRGAQDVNLRVNSYSSTHITISWDQGSPTALLMQTRTSSPEDSASDTITAEAESDHPILFLKINRYGPTFHGSVIPDNSDSTSATKALPSKGTYTIRNLLPDTQYLLQLAPLQPMDDGATSGLALNDVATPGYSTTACCTELVVQTLPEPVFQLDKESSGKNLVVFNQNLSARNTVNKKWHSVRASVAFDEGVHQWHVRLDTCVSKNIFIGVCTAEASMENYIGSDGFGYGFLANKAVWHNKAKLHSYGEIFKQGDLIQVTLDCNAKTLAFSRNGEYLGIAATNMRAGTSRTGIGSNTSSEGSCKWYPAFSMYNKDDKLTLIPPPAISIFSSKDGRSQNASTFNLIEAMKDVLAYESNVTSVDFSSDNTSTKLFEKAFREFERWRRDEVIYREIAVGHIIAINKSRIATDKYGLATGDSVFTSKGQCCVLGEYRHELWYEVDQGGGSSLFGTSVSQLASWSLSACREMLSSPDEYPVHRHHQYKLKRENQTVETEESAVKQQDPAADTLDNSFHSFVDAQKQWSNNANAAEADTTLIAELNVIRSSSQSSNTSQMLSFADVSVALLIEKLNEVHGISTKCDSNQTLARIGLLLHVNRCLYNIVRFTLPRNILATSLRACGRPKSSINQHDLGEQAPNEANSECYQVSPVAALLNSPYWALDDPSAFSQLPVLAARLLFSSQKNKLIDEELQRTKTAIQNSDSSFQEPSDNEDGGIDTGILPIKISYPLSPAVPFWELKSISLKSRCCRLPASREGLVFVQLAKQLSAQDAHQWRRESSLPFEAIPISQTFQVIVEKLPVVLSEDSTGIELDQQQQEKNDDDQESSSKQTANYLTLFESAVREVQSPCFPLFVPIQTSCVDDGPIQLVLDVNMELFSPSALAHSGVKSSQVMSWFFCFGQLLGMAWRSKLLLPLQFLSKAFWSELVNPTVDDLEATAQSRYQSMAISAIRDGLFSIIPSRCVALLSGSNPSLRERLSDLDVSYVDRLERHAVYVGPRQGHHDLFWRVVSAFTSVERRMLEQFVNPEQRSVAKQVEVVASRADASSIFILEIADALADGRDHPDSCYPVVVPMSPHSSRLHLPAYSSALTLRHKLLLAMTNIPFM